MKRIANVRFEQLRDYSGKSEADAAKWRKKQERKQVERSKQRIKLGKHEKNITCLQLYK